MGLKTKFTAPGGYVAEDGYRRVTALHVDFSGPSVQIDVGNYKDQAWRDKHPSSYTPAPPCLIAATATAAKKGVYEDDAGELQIVKVPEIPSGAEWLDQPLATYLPEVTSATTIRAMLGAICYGFIKTRPENEGAVDA